MMEYNTFSSYICYRFGAGEDPAPESSTSPGPAHAMGIARIGKYEKNKRMGKEKDEILISD